tara:strand:+ start:792 stop:1901 length:1110 start_codon:yes stop_codon:yes gene_type:complete
MPKVKASVLYEPHTPMVIKELDQEEPKSGEVRIKMLNAGVCASDHHVIAGETSFEFPIVLGHEGSGIVDKVGPNVTSISKGDKCILSFVPSCGSCNSCRSGLGNICDTNRLTGTRQYDGTFRLKDESNNEIHQFAKLGVFAEKIVIPESACFKIDDDFPSDVACLIGCSVTTGVGGVINQPDMFPGASVAVFGAGGVGLNALLGAQLMNSTKIIAIDINDSKLEFSYKFGATHTINSKSEDPVKKIMDITDGLGVDFVFDTFGSTQIVTQMMAALKKGGTGVIIGVAPVGAMADIDPQDMVRNHKKIVGSYYGSVSPHITFERIIDFYKSGKLKIDTVIERAYSLDQINEAYDDLVSGKDGRGVIAFPK